MSSPNFASRHQRIRASRCSWLSFSTDGGTFCIAFTSLPGIRRPVPRTSSRTIPVRHNGLLIMGKGLQQRPPELAGAERRASDSPRRIDSARIDVGKDKILPVAAAADEDLPIRVHDVAVPIADPLIAQSAVAPLRDIIPAHEIDRVL